MLSWGCILNAITNSCTSELPVTMCTWAAISFQNQNMVCKVKIVQELKSHDKITVGKVEHVGELGWHKLCLAQLSNENPFTPHILFDLTSSVSIGAFPSAAFKSQLWWCLPLQRITALCLHQWHLPRRLWSGMDWTILWIHRYDSVSPEGGFAHERACWLGGQSFGCYLGLACLVFWGCHEWHIHPVCYHQWN